MATNPNSIPTPLPKYIYKILPHTAFPSSPYPPPLSSDPSSATIPPNVSPPDSPTPDTLPPALPLSKLDSRDGFIHLSTSFQLLGTLRNFFASEEWVWILRIEYKTVAQFIKWENSKGKGPEEVGGCWDIQGKAGYFPHIYNNDPNGVGQQGLKLGRDEVDAVGRFERKGEQWGPEGWCWDVDAPVFTEK